jgi:class I fructose-bisphosphate aldolase
MITPKDAVRMGAEAAVMFLMVGANDGKLFADNVAAVSKAAQEAHEVGLPLIVESVLWGSRIEDKKDPSGSPSAPASRSSSARTPSRPRTPATRRPCARSSTARPRPVLLLGGSKSPDPEALWKSTEASIESGARASSTAATSGRRRRRRRLHAAREIIHGAPAA